MSRINDTFSELQSRGQMAFMPFVTAGDPDMAATLALIRELAERGVDLIEVEQFKRVKGHDRPKPLDQLAIGCFIQRDADPVAHETQVVTLDTSPLHNRSGPIIGLYDDGVEIGVFFEFPPHPT